MQLILMKNILEVRYTILPNVRLISLLISQAGGEGFKRLNIIQPQNELPIDHQYGRKSLSRLGIYSTKYLFNKIRLVFWILDRFPLKSVKSMFHYSLKKPKFCLIF